jgi:hypothetical protein
MANYLEFGIATLCIVWMPLGVLALKLWRKVVSLRTTVKTLQRQVDQLRETNLLLVLKRREEALQFGVQAAAPKCESSEVLPLNAPSVVSSR